MKKLGMLLGCGLMALAIGCGAEEVKPPTVSPTTLGTDYKAKMEGGAAPAGDAAAPAGDAAGEKKEGDAPAEKKEGDAPAEKKEGDAPAEKKE